MDQMDRRILDELLIDGRISQQDLAAKTGLSRAAAARRLASLLVSSGVRIVGLVHPSVLGQTVMAHVAVDVDGSVGPLGASIAGEEGIPFVSVALGSKALVAEIRVRSQEELFQSVARIRALPGVVATTVSTYTELLVDVLAQSNPARQEPDEIDHLLIEALRRDGRATYAAMAEVAGVSAGTARSRVLKLLENGVVRIGVIWDPGTQDRQQRVGLGLRVRGSSAEVAARLSTLAGMTFLATTIGQYDIVASVDGSTPNAVVAALNEIRRQPEVLQCETWVHLQVLKERH